jgi:hypothetical protein
LACPDPGHHPPKLTWFYSFSSSKDWGFCNSHHTKHYAHIDLTTSQPNSLSEKQSVERAHSRILICPHQSLIEQIPGDHFEAYQTARSATSNPKGNRIAMLARKDYRHRSTPSFSWCSTIFTYCRCVRTVVREQHRRNPSPAAFPHAGQHQQHC